MKLRKLNESQLRFNVTDLNFFFYLNLFNISKNLKKKW